MEDPFIREIRLEKERQIKKEEDDKIARRIFEKVILSKFCLGILKKKLFYLCHFNLNQQKISIIIF